MSDLTRIAVFYSSDEIDVKDVEREIFTEEKKKFHLFFFHNLNLHFSKNEIFKTLIHNKFKPIVPEMEFELRTKTLTMTKKMINFNFPEFDKEVNDLYEQYLSNINYRINCIFETFSIFFELYKDKSIIYILPSQLMERFHEMLKKSKLTFDKINIDHDFIRRFDILYWSNYFSRTDSANPEDGKIHKENITNIIEIK